MNKETLIQSPKSQKEIPLKELMPLIQERIARGQSVRFYPQGISMLPMLKPGRDSVELSAPPERLKKYDLPLYQRRDGSFVLHRVVHVGDTYCCVGDNQLRAEKGIAHEQVIALVTAFYKGEQRHSVKELRYRLYCRCRFAYRWLCYRRIKRATKQQPKE